MTNEDDWSHFAPLQTKFGYHISGYRDYASLSRFVEGCEKSAKPFAACENYLLYVAEEAIANMIPSKRRIATFGTALEDSVKGALVHASHLLMDGTCTL